MSSSRKILIAITTGILLGIFLGERASILQYIANAYIRLLQMTVLPYVTVSLIAGIGGLRLDQAKTLGLRVGLILVLMWSIALAMALLVPLAFPQLQMASFFSTSLVEPQRRANVCFRSWASGRRWGRSSARPRRRGSSRSSASTS